jgi:4-amino-4-deoxy-L-arabinose transferase-like glycosyltransferase/Tfp pilus assembly protein PilF
VLFALLLLCGAAAVLFRIGAPSMWVDEAAARAQGNGSVHELLTHPDTHIRLSHAYLLINRLSAALITDVDVALRLPQALAALLSLVFVYLLGRHLFSPGAGLLAMALVLAHPVFIRYAQENRPQQLLSMCMLGMYYCLVRYLDRRAWPALAGLVLLASFALRCGYGVLPVGVLFGMPVALGLAQFVAGRAHCPYALDRWRVLELVLAGVLILALWWPYPWWELQRALREGIAGSLKRGVPQLDLFWNGAMSAAPAALLALCRDFFLYSGTTAAWLALLVALCAGSVWYGRGRALVFILIGMLITLISLHVMNRAGGGVVPRRYVYLCPWTMLCVAGGAHMTARLAGDVVGALTLHARARRIARGCAWLALVALLLGPQLWYSVHQLSQYYYTDRHIYKTAAAALAAHARVGEAILYVDTDHRDWTLEQYLPRTVPLTYAGTYYIPDPNFVKQPLLTAAVITNVLAQTDGVWVLNVDPADYGVPPALVVRVPCGESMRLGTLALIRRGYATDPAQRARDTEALLRTVIQQSRYPKVAATRMLAAWYHAQGAAPAAEVITARLARFPWSHAARTAMVAAQAGNAPPITNAVRVAWVDYTDFGRQADVCGMADATAWLGCVVPRPVPLSWLASGVLLLSTLALLAGGLFVAWRRGADRTGVVITGPAGMALLTVLWLETAVPGLGTTCGMAFAWNALALLVLLLWLLWLAAPRAVTSAPGAWQMTARGDIPRRAHNAPPLAGKGDDDGNATARWLTWLHCLLLLAACALVFSNTLHNSFHLDDFYSIRDNPGMQQVWPPWRHFFDPTTFSAIQSTVQYRPLLPLTLSLNYALHGEALPGYHLVNIAAHALSAVVCYLLFLRILRVLRPTRVAEQCWPWLAWLAALWYGLHPIAGFPVNYLIARDLLLMQLFFLLALYTYVRMRMAGECWWRWSVTLLCALAALLSKTNAVALPGMLLLLECIVFRERITSWRALRRIGVSVLTVALFLAWVTWVVRFSDAANLLAGDRAGYLRAQVQVHLVTYLRNVVWPFTIRALPEVGLATSWFDGRVALGALLIAGSVAWALWCRRRAPLIAFTILAYWCMVALESSVFPLHIKVTDYRTYPALPFLTLLLAYAVLRWLRGVPAALVCAAITLYFGGATFVMNRHYLNEETFWRHSVRHGTGALGTMNYAMQFAGKDDATARKYLEDALRLNPYYYLANVNYGLCLLRQGEHARGLAFVRNGADYTPATCKDLSYRWLAEAYATVGDASNAYAAIAVCAAANPRQLDNVYRAAYLAQAAQRYAEALEHLRHVHAQTPTIEISRFIAGWAHQAQGQLDAALAEYALATNYTPAYAQTYANMGYALKQLGRYAEAATAFEQHLALAPSNTGARAARDECREKTR